MESLFRLSAVLAAATMTVFLAAAGPARCFRHGPLPYGGNAMKLLLAIFAWALALASLANAKSLENDAEWFNTVPALKWRDGETLTLPLSGGTVRASAPVKQLAGSDAAQAMAGLTGSAPPFAIEALLYDAVTGEVVVYQKLGRGYVRFDDWVTLDANAVLKAFAERVEADNARRRRVSLPGMHVVGWLEAPYLDRSTHSVRWAIELAGDHGLPVVSSAVLVFGRDGFEKLTWGGKKMMGAKNLLRVAQSSFSFPVGSRYADYELGDAIAEYGVADTVAAVLGAKRAAK